MKKCPFCQEEIQDTAIKCRYCGEWLEKEGPASNKDVSNDKNATPLEPPSPQQRTEIKRDSDNVQKKIKEKSTKYSWLINASMLLGALIVLVFVKGFTRTIVRSHGTSPFLGDLILITLVCWAWFRGWKWWALLPPAIVFGLAFIWSIGAAAAGGAEIENAKNFALILVLICWVVLGIMIFLKRKPSGKDSTTATKEDAEIEKIIREAETQPIKEGQGVTTPSTLEARQRNEEFISLLKASIKENKLDTISNEDLKKIYHRAKLIDMSSNNIDIELSKAISTLSDEIKKRGLSPDVKPQEKSSPEEFLFAKEVKKATTARVTLAIIIVGAIALVFLFLNDIRSNPSNQKTQNNYTVTESQEVPQAPIAEEYKEPVSNSTTVQNEMPQKKRNSSGLDLIGFRDKYKKFYGDMPLEDVAKDMYVRGEFYNQMDFETWKKSAKIDKLIQEDNERRKKW